MSSVTVSAIAQPLVQGAVDPSEVSVSLVQQAADACVITPPVSRQALAPPQDGITLLLNAQGGLANQPVALDGLDALLQARARTQQASLILKVDAATTARTLDPVLQAIRRAGISQLTLLTARP